MVEKEMILDEEKNINIEMIPIDKLEANRWNPNRMSDFDFHALAIDITKGFHQPILVVPKGNGFYRIIDGYHRYEAAKMMDLEEIPCIVVKSGDLVESEDAQKFKTVRMNKLRGKLDKRKFKALVEDLASRYPIDYVAENFALEDDQPLRDMIATARRELPTLELKKEFDKRKNEIQSIEDLASLLTRLYTRYGKTLDYGYMVLEHGGQKHLWVRLKELSMFEFCKEKAKLASDKGVSFSSVILKALEQVDDAFIRNFYDSLEKVETEEEDGEYR